MDPRDEEIEQLRARIAVVEASREAAEKLAAGEVEYRQSVDTERRQTEDRLRRSEAQLRDAQEVGHLGSWEWDLQTNVITRSAEFCRIVGKSEKEFGTGAGPSFDLVHADDRERFCAALDRAIALRQPCTLDYRIVRPGGVRFLHTRVQVVCGEGGEPLRLLATAQDVTERKQVEDRLMLADRMASIGTLAAGVAHEVNNPLTYVLTNLDLLGEQIQELAGLTSAAHFQELAELISEARQGSERIRKIVRGLKSFARDDEERRGLLDVRQVLDSALNMACNEVRHRARLVKDYEDVPPIFADEGRLVQVFINLLVNAAQAIPEGQAETNEIRVVARKNAAGGVLIEVRDTGPGMAQPVLDRIFDPFFTTKPVGVGTGLGLSICHGIISAHGGEITVGSEPGRGTVFQIVLPAAQPPEAKSDAANATTAALTGKRGRVLVVDDEAIVGNALRRILKDHDVTVLSDAREARSRLVHGERYDLILCDLMMPEMTGMELHTELARETPEQAERLVFLTGGAFTPAATEFLDRVPNERLEKPFVASNLRALVQRFLP